MLEYHSTLDGDFCIIRNLVHWVLVHCLTGGKLIEMSLVGIVHLAGWQNPALAYLQLSRTLRYSNHRVHGRVRIGEKALLG